MCFGGILRGKMIERFIQHKELVCLYFGGDLDFIYIHSLLAAAMAQRAFAPRVFDQNASHSLGRGGEEMCPAAPSAVSVAAEPEPGFVDECSRLESLAGLFSGQAVGGEVAQFGINQRKQFLSGIRMALINFLEYAREIVHFRARSSSAPTLESEHPLFAVSLFIDSCMLLVQRAIFTRR